MILLTGMPNTGKSTAIMSLIDVLGRDRCGGFYTKEILQDGQRVGFRTHTFSGKEFILAHVDFPKVYAVEEFGVDLDSFERICIDEILNCDKQYLIIDEIGSMQLYSDKFKKLLLDLHKSERKIIATICMIDTDFTAVYKDINKDNLYTLDLNNRNEMPFILAERINQDDELYLSKLKLSLLYNREQDRFTYEDDKIILRSTHGIRTISKENGTYHCTCDYYKDHGTCSHIMAIVRNRYNH